MMLSNLHACPHCDCFVAREHNVRAVRADRVYAALYCEFCGWGWEAEVHLGGAIYRLEWCASDPHWPLFLERLADARDATDTPPPASAAPGVRIPSRTIPIGNRKSAIANPCEAHVA
jgi:hypothetical protein